MNTRSQEILDLRSSSKLTKVQSRLLDQIAVEIRPAYTEFVSEFFKDPDNSIQWHLTPLMCRNTHDCKIFNSLCQIELVKRYCSSGQSGTVIVDSPYFYQTIKKICHPKIKLVNTKSRFSRVLSIIAKNTKLLMFMAFNFSMRFIFSRIIRIQPLSSELSKITLVDTVFYKTSFKNKKFYDRHFPGIFEGLSGDESESIFFIGYYYKIYNFFDFFKKLKSSTSNVLAIEEYLKFSDYFYAMFSFVFLFKKFKSVLFDGFDITDLFLDCYYENVVNIGSSEGLLRQRFMSRLKERGVKLHSVLMWFENQPINRGSQIGLNQFYPDTPTNGYIGFYNSTNVVGVYPSSEELHARFLPHIISVIGKNIAPEMKAFCPGLNVMASPALRFQELLNVEEEGLESPNFVILVALPIFEHESLAILELLSAALQRFDNVAVKVKAHPGSSGQATENVISEFGFEGCVTEVRMYDAILASDIVITSASSSAVEAVLMGRPTLIVSDCRGPTKNPIPHGIPKDLYAVCYDLMDVEYNIRVLMNSSEDTIALRKKAASKCLEHYVDSYTPEKSRMLLGIVGS